MSKKPKALDLAGWRKTQIVTTPKGRRSMTQAELGRALGLGNSIICRIEAGERWPTVETWARLWRIVRPPVAALRIAIYDGQLATWRAYSSDRKGRTP